MEKINIAELLKDCPKGMELDCILFSAKVIYKGLSKRIPTHPIVVQTEHGFEFELTQYGQIHNIVGSNCVIFPKGKTSWEGFHRPFKDGDIIQDKDGYKVKITEVNIEDECYGYESMIVKGIGGIAFKEQDDWKLVPNKFDINSLIPFESKVLVRYTKNSKWCGSFFSFIDRDIHSHCYKFVTTANKSYPMMIPYKGNEYLLGKVEDCKDFYKTLE